MSTTAASTSPANISPAPVADKNVRRLNPLYATDIYHSYFDKGQTSATVGYEDGSTHKYELLKRYEDKDTGFVAASFISRDDGHAILLYKGMDKPFSDQGGGHFRFLKHIWTIAQGHMDGYSPQHKKAEEAYFETMKNPAVKDMEIGGFSMGTMFSNYIAAKHDAKATVFADLGISDHQLAQIFNERSQNQPAAVPASHGLDTMIQKMRDNVTVLKMKGDLLPQIFALGASRGKIIDLDRGPNPDPQGIEHNPAIYTNRAELVEAAMGLPVFLRGFAPAMG
jgi:hypothetical protein